MSPPSKSTTSIELFFSYAHEDEELRNELAKHLRLLERRKVISAWHDRRIGAGKEWEQEIDTRLNQAHLILLLVSSDFLASDYCYDVEMKRAMERHETGDARVIPVILRDVDWRGAPFSKLNALPTDGKPVTAWPNRDAAFTSIEEGIKKAAEELLRGQIEHLFEKLEKAESLKNWPNAIELGERILKLLPDDKVTRSRTAEAYIENWRRRFDGSLYFNPGTLSLNHRLEELLRSPDNSRKIKADLTRAQELDPDNANVYYWRSAVIGTSLNEKIADMTQAIRIDPRAAYYYIRSVLLARSGHQEAARQDLDHAAKLGDKRAQAEVAREQDNEQIRDLLGFKPEA